MSPAPLDRAMDFIARLVDDPSERGLAQAIEADPGAPEAIARVLHGRFVEGGAGFGALEDDPTFWRLLAIAVTTWSPAARQTFADETLFNASAPDAYRWLAPLARALFPAADAERLVLAGIDRGDERARANASHLAYHLFEAAPGYALSELGAQRLAAGDPFRAVGG